MEMPNAHASPQPGEVVAATFRIVRLIGRGGMGTVYEVEHLRTRRALALKFLRHDREPSARAKERFEREAEALARLEHENIVGFVDIGFDETYGSYLVLEYVRGRTLRHELQECGVRSLARVLGILTQIERALSLAHRAGIVHRDLKPENVILGSHADGRMLVKVLDFGVARMCNELSNQVTVTDSAVGTAAYMSPEQARGERDIDARTDLFALAVMTYEALSGSRPHGGTSYNETLFQILHQPHRPLVEFRPDLPTEVIACIERALCKVREDRHADVASFVKELATAAGKYGGDEEAADSQRATVSDVVRLAGGAGRRPAARALFVAASCLAALAFGIGWYSRDTLATEARVEAVPLPAASASRIPDAGCVGLAEVAAPAAAQGAGRGPAAPPPKFSPIEGTSRVPRTNTLSLANSRETRRDAVAPAVSPADPAAQGYIVESPYIQRSH